MEKQTPDWSKEDFIAFVLAYAAHADLEITGAELDVICQQVGQRCYEKVLPLLKSQSDYQNLQVLLEQRERFFPGEAGKQLLMDQVQELFQADGKVSQLERIYNKGLRRLL